VTFRNSLEGTGLAGNFLEDSLESFFDLFCTRGLITIFSNKNQTNTRTRKSIIFREDTFSRMIFLKSFEDFMRERMAWNTVAWATRKIFALPGPE